MRAEFRGPSGSRQAIDAAPLFATATAGGTLVPGQLVKASGNPFTVVAAGDGESVYGVCRNHAVSGETVTVLIQGITTLTAKSGASWASHRRVCAAASGEVDEGSTNDPWFGTLLSHDGNVALVMVHGDALPSLARGVRAADGTAYAFGTLTADQPVVLRTGRAESVRPIGTTAQRPSSPYNGQTYYDTDVDVLFIYDGTRWLSSPFPVCVGSVRGSAVSTFNPGPGGLASDDTNSPIFFGRTVRILSIASQLRGGTGSRVWTTRLRLDGSGSDSFACTNTITSSAATWVRAAEEAVGLSLTATNRLNIVTNATGGSETYAYSATLTCAWEG